MAEADGRKAVFAHVWHGSVERVQRQQAGWLQNLYEVANAVNPVFPLRPPGKLIAGQAQQPHH
eukprot:CAMPEP_0172934032 /NCGR_PEP_ID=MMETSP1075-20121228/220806_1 /TAXON_ID=2916 /ORGANISM="Ceratium fusus, Strain PA161109" /LENGTH=62 /DNA_ID=CAMNT_0013795379 /DNA_START=1018 /DNA_END=1206 /DNA_ORIENTATION=-